MSGKYAKKNRKKKKKSTNPVVPILVALLLVLVIGIVAMLLLRPEAPGESRESQPPVETTLPQQMTDEITIPSDGETEPGAQIQFSLPYDLGNGLMLTGISNYAGLYLEDGSDEPVSGILMISLENTSGRDLQLARVELIYQGQTASFQITNLPAGRKLVALEQSRMAYTQEMPVAAMADSLAFVEDFGMCEGQIQVGGLDGALNIQNISGEDIPGNIVIYYKNVAGELFYGGITYRITIEGGLKAEEIRQIMSAHFHADSSEIVMVSCGG